MDLTITRRGGTGPCFKIPRDNVKTKKKVVNDQQLNNYRDETHSSSVVDSEQSHDRRVVRSIENERKVLPKRRRV